MLCVGFFRSCWCGVPRFWLCHIGFLLLSVFLLSLLPIPSSSECSFWRQQDRWGWWVDKDGVCPDSGWTLLRLLNPPQDRGQVVERGEVHPDSRWAFPDLGGPLFSCWHQEEVNRCWCRRLGVGQNSTQTHLRAPAAGQRSGFRQSNLYYFKQSYT